MRKKILSVGMGGAVVLLLILTRCFLGSQEAYEKGTQLLQKGEVESAILSFDHAIHWYFPGNPFPERSIQSLWKLGNDLQNKQDPSMALLAFDSLRGGIYSIRNVYWPYRDWLPQVNEKIARLRGMQEAKQNPQLRPEDAYEKHLKLLTRDERPQTAWVVLMGVGFLGWLFSIVAWIWKGFDAEGKILLRKSIPWVIAAVIFFALWVGSLLKA